MTEYERMRAGRIYDCMDAELGAAQRESHRLCEAYNALGADYNAFLLFNSIAFVWRSLALCLFLYRYFRFRRRAAAA